MDSALPAFVACCFVRMHNVCQNQMQVLQMFIFINVLTMGFNLPLGTELAVALFSGARSDLQRNGSEPT